MLYYKPLASYWSPTALKRPDRSKQCHCLFFVISQKVLIAETRLNILSEDINKVLSIKTILQQLISRY